jgi:hypothetical protein
MSNAQVMLTGIVRGKTIELERDAGLPDGQEVSVVLRPKLPPGEGLRRAFGSWADDPDGVDRFVEETYRLRLLDRPELPE